LKEFEEGRRRPLYLNMLAVVTTLCATSPRRRFSVHRRFAQECVRLLLAHPLLLHESLRVDEASRAIRILRAEHPHEQQGMSEQEAYALLRKTAMNENRRLGEVAQSVVTTASMFK